MTLFLNTISQYTKGSDHISPSLLHEVLRHVTDRRRVVFEPFEEIQVGACPRLRLAFTSFR